MCKGITQCIPFPVPQNTNYFLVQMYRYAIMNEERPYLHCHFNLLEIL